MAGLMPHAHSHLTNSVDFHQEESANFGWALLSGFLALVVAWRLGDALFNLFTCAVAPDLAGHKVTDGRSPQALALGLCGATNSLVCLATFLLQLDLAMRAGHLQSGLLAVVEHATRNSLHLVLPPPHFRLALLSLAAYCSCYVVWVAAGTGVPDRLAQFHRALVLFTAVTACLVRFVPIMNMMLILQEVPNIFVALWQALASFGAGDCSQVLAAACLVLTSFGMRVLLFGAILYKVAVHPDAHILLGGEGSGLLLCLYGTLLLVQAAQFTMSIRDMYRRPPCSSMRKRPSVGGAAPSATKAEV